MASTQDVLNNHLDTFSKGDVDGIMSDYSAESVIFTPEGPLQGPDAIRPAFEALVEEFGKPGMSFEMLYTTVHGECAYIVWKAETADNVYELATDTFVIQNGKIQTQTFTAKVTPKG